MGTTHVVLPECGSCLFVGAIYYVSPVCVCALSCQDQISAGLQRVEH